jgi:hypothetical protein
MKSPAVMGDADAAVAVMALNAMMSAVDLRDDISAT